MEFVCVDEVDYCLPCSSDPAAAEQARPHAYEVAENALVENAAAAAVALAPTCAAEPEPTTRQQLLLLCQAEYRELCEMLLQARSPNLIRSYMCTHHDLCMEIERLSTEPSDAPDHLICPFSYNLMGDPVINPNIGSYV